MTDEEAMIEIQATLAKLKVGIVAVVNERNVLRDERDAARVEAADWKRLAVACRDPLAVTAAKRLEPVGNTGSLAWVYRCAVCEPETDPADAPAGDDPIVEAMVAAWLPPETPPIRRCTGCFDCDAAPHDKGCPQFGRVEEPPTSPADAEGDAPTSPSATTYPCCEHCLKRVIRLTPRGHEHLRRCKRCGDADPTA